ncbi:putative C6 finger domain protein [Arthroderma uncinatum]|uniref:putative C6 finger domain protein n=1 Tax=Arthroderma uncinatum TaxID=74035 RepID=UPI00144A5CBE|nr:putative C6 finger domain protein [Arthroderma uncinatum]KAF3482040.1 putative C6 finger domain protein [Arthroderma uncinatum]
MPAQGGERHEGRKNYVFVDEHNRHKRLKVMRACNGCRKRKIKCDSATTNIWPCSACTRLKLVCIPPSIDQEGEASGHEQILDFSQPMLNQSSGSITSAASSQPLSIASTQPSFHAREYYPAEPSRRAGDLRGYESDSQLYQSQQPYLTSPTDDGRFYHHSPLDASASMQQSFHYAPTSHPPPHPRDPPHALPHQSHPPPPQFTVSTPQQPLIQVAEPPQDTHPQDLTHAFDELKIDETGIAPYINQESKDHSKSRTALTECEESLPSLYSGSGSSLQFPAELMPSDSEAMGYFKIYFDDIHPYLPVVPRNYFYEQWRREKWDISPLLLSALFACSARALNDTAKATKWLALANKFEPEFMEAPRLSTVQALLLIMKAREAMPRPGYYYRSWQTVKTIISMSKDLELHQHYQYHAEGKLCGYDTVECLIRTRVWQTTLVVEIMVGGPQGRSEFGVETDTVETRPSWDIPNLDAYEAERSRQFGYFVHNALNIRRIVDTFHKLKKTKDWGANPQFSRNNPLFEAWYNSLPPDLMVTYPPDGSPPWIPSHFVANMHSHFELAKVMLHRPQFVAASSFPAGGEWRHHFSICYRSAKALCRLQEALLSSFGVAGFLCMQRGINFSIYCILTSVMLHLIAITSPDPEFNKDSRSYFTRHMRVLEQCSSSWPMTDLQSQLAALRLAFSADINKPFELKPTFPYGSPAAQSTQPLPASEPLYHSPSYSEGPHEATPSHLSFNDSYPISPPVSAQTSAKPESPATGNYGLLQPYDTTRPPPTMNVPLVDENSWNPSRIITQWDLAFAGNINSNSPPSATSSSTTSTVMPDPHSLYPSSLSTTSPASAPQYPDYSQTTLVPLVDPNHAPQVSMPTQQYNMLPVVMGARDWQRSVASVIDPEGAKRRWDDTDDYGGEQSKRRR